MVNGQRIRSRTGLESIFKTAGLVIAKQIGPKELYQTMLPVVVWALILPTYEPSYLK